jgi:hypothetical protein
VHHEQHSFLGERPRVHISCGYNEIFSQILYGLYIHSYDQYGLLDQLNIYPDPEWMMFGLPAEGLMAWRSR